MKDTNMKLVALPSSTSETQMQEGFVWILDSLSESTQKHKEGISELLQNQPWISDIIRNQSFDDKELNKPLGSAILILVC